MYHGKQFTLYTHVGGPNGWKVALLLEELGLSYESTYLDFQKNEQKQSPHIDYNPNGRIPTLIDHKNEDFVLWESNAILLYLVDKYDAEKRLTVTDEKEKHVLDQWLFFQASGQGPYFGQYFWFARYHPEKVPSAIERYQKETQRVLGVLDGVLAKSPSGWLVGGKFTIADLSFYTWDRAAISSILKDVEGVDVEKQFPAFWAWHKKTEARDSVKKLTELQAGLRTQTA
ncbi:glutathione S-transferase C-terminal-like protein [Lentinus brumalis]|uniref:glutathione transferase n=1 Tax=Lentinus brumalis TaxID=2498619 RepID=A0A371CRB3_9APHY|nr:glutathione S-transferase C-terminal-like protein [Polyporus brumalis]